LFPRYTRHYEQHPVSRSRRAAPAILRATAPVPEECSKLRSGASNRWRRRGSLLGLHRYHQNFVEKSFFLSRKHFHLWYI
jgi:hypothetical protein